MITFVASFSHLYTFTALRGDVLGPTMPTSQSISYDELFAAEGLRAGTYVFTDFERLHPHAVRYASHIWKYYSNRKGFRFLNEPARVRTRYGLLRSLKDAGVNDFDVYCAEGHPRPHRFPVFLRMSSNHLGAIGDLIENQQELDERLVGLEDQGISLTGVIVIEFCAEREEKSGLYEKLSVFRIGDRLALSSLLVGDRWDVKEPNMDLVDGVTMQRHLEAMREDRYAEQIRSAFDVAGITYGRADMGFGDGKLQVYEINTNPMIKAGATYSSAEHRESREIYRARFSDMMHAIDLPKGSLVRMNPKLLDPDSKNLRELALQRVRPKQKSQELLPFWGRGWWRSR